MRGAILSRAIRLLMHGRRIRSTVETKTERRHRAAVGGLWTPRGAGVIFISTIQGLLNYERKLGARRLCRPFAGHAARHRPPAGPRRAEGGPAGEVADKVGVSASNVSFHHKELERAALIEARREARSILYSANTGTLRDLIGFLMKDCCGGRPEICAPLPSGRASAPAKQKKSVHA